MRERKKEKRVCSALAAGGASGPKAGALLHFPSSLRLSFSCSQGSLQPGPARCIVPAWPQTAAREAVLACSATNHLAREMIVKYRVRRAGLFPA